MADPTGLAPEQLRALDRLSAVSDLDRFYMAGGGAIAYHLGHRRSRDVDLFSYTADVDLERTQACIVAALPDVEVVYRSDAALKLLLSQTEVDLVRYPYPTLTPPGPGPAGYRVASIADLGAMKLAAIVSRGIQRDFWDLFVIARSGESLEVLLDGYTRKFGRAESDLYHVMRALTFFEDADRETIRPAGLNDHLWAEIKDYFRAAVPGLLRRLTST